ncbi:MAG: pilin [Candidatus Moranbacteria bacterium]|nr:pilin [Candidatus Moranbacteria bacterium]
MSIKKSLLLAALLFQFGASSALAETFLIIEHGECAKATTEGGWGGSCEALFLDGDVTSISEFFGGSNGCDNDAEKPVGLCGNSGSVDGGLREACCVPKSSTAKGKVVGQFMEEAATCTLPIASGGGVGGTCQSSNCDSNTQDYIGICEGSVTDDYCCAPKGQVVPPSVSGTVVGDTDGVGNHGGDSAGIGNVGNINVGTNYTPLENVPFIQGTTLSEYLRGVYILGLVLVVIGAVFMLVIGGFQYLTSAGNTSALSSAKHTIEGALFGLFLALVAYLILYVINPDLVNLKISSFQPLALQANPASGGGSGGGAGGGGATGSTRPCAGGLIAIPSALGQRLTSSSTNQICKDIADRLVQLKQRTGINIYVTSSVRSGGALSGCHVSGNADSGNCADIGINTSLPLHDPRWDALCTAVGSTPGLQLVNEASNSAACTRVSPFRQYSTSNGAHFHVKFIGP